MTPATKTILICDDDQGMRDTIAAILGRDYRVLTVSSGEAALTMLRHEEVDVMLQDVRLPGMSGLTCFVSSRNSCRWSRCSSSPRSTRSRPPCRR